MSGTETKIPPRPSDLGDEVRASIVTEVWNQFTMWWRHHSGQEFPKDLTEWIKQSVDPNPYIFAKNFELLSGVTPDDRLVELFRVNISQHHYKCTDEWRERFDVSVPATHLPGAKVATALFPRCTVVSINYEIAKIGIVPDGFPHEMPEGGFMIAYEDAIPIIGTLGKPVVAVGGAA